MRALTLTFLFLALTASPALAATTVRVEDQFPGEPVNPGITVTDETGEVNTLTISYSYETNGAPFPPPGNAKVTVEDGSAELQAGEGCQQNGPSRVRCDVDGIVRIVAATETTG
jgi:hypothetical protein